MSSTPYILNGDLYISADSGRIYLVDGVDKCSQDVAEILYTPYSTVTGYGSDLIDVVNYPVMAKGAMQNFIKLKISEAIDRLKNMQREDPFSTIDERILNVRNLQLKYAGNSTYLFYLQLDVEDPTADVENILAIKMLHNSQVDVVDLLNNLEF